MLESRRVFLNRGVVGIAGMVLASGKVAAAEAETDRYQLSLHQYSLKSLFDAGTLELRNYARFAKEKLGLSNIEFAAEFCGNLVSSLEMADALGRQSEAVGVNNRVLLCADSTPLDSGTDQARATAVAAHLGWAKVAEHLGCEFMRVRASSNGDRQQQLAHAAAGIGALCEATKSSPVSLLVENIAGFSRDANWLIELVKRVGVERVGVLADFGNFDGNIYQGMKQLLPYTKSICTKSWSFDDQGNETKIDFRRMMGLIKDSEFRGCIAVEYLGDESVAGVRKTLDLVKRYL